MLQQPQKVLCFDVHLQSLIYICYMKYCMQYVLPETIEQHPLCQDFQHNTATETQVDALKSWSTGCTLHHFVEPF